MKKIKHLIKLISIIVLFMAPASCDLVTESIIIENAVNVGSCHITLRYNKSVMNVTNVEGVDFDVTIPNLEHVDEGWARIGAFQTGKPGLNGRRIILADVTFNKTADVSNICSLIGITVNTLKDATPQCNPISYMVGGCAIVVPTDSSNRDGGSGLYPPTPTPTPAPTPSATQAAPSAAAAPAEDAPPANTTTPTPEKVTAFRTEPLSPSPPVLSPIAGIVLVVIATILGVIKVIGITARTRDETYAEAITSIKQADCRKAIAAIIGIVVVAIVAIIAIILMM